MSNDFIKELIIKLIKNKLSKEYSEIRLNPNSYPDLILINHGFTVAVLQVETENTIEAHNTQRWRQIVQDNPKVIIMIPSSCKAKLIELLWAEGIFDRVNIGTYDIVIKMP
ncbi:MAG: hypothetical protein N3A59_08790 [Thermodesulfovibrionales bacterium]|nr:hypothetical protein [Thermodesulfovibrionales bacterium]